MPLVGNDLELTSYPFATNNCVTTPSAPESRQPLSHMRFLWDVWDSHNDGTGDSYTANIPGHYAGHINLPQFYPAGQRQISTRNLGPITLARAIL